MDEDAMPKDRMAVLGDPAAQGLMYVAGNAGALAWRVNISAGVWTKMWDTPDVYGNFDIISGPFPPFLGYIIPHASCGILCLVSMRIAG